MADFTLDTSGVVIIRAADGVNEGHTWEVLDPFTQGYVEALFASLSVGGSHVGSLQTSHGEIHRCTFSDLAPEALAVILRDCGLFRATDQWRRFARLCPVGWLNLNKEPGEQAAGAAFWATRNHHTGQSRGDFWTDHAWPSTYAQQLFYAARAFPPLTPSLGDDGKVYLRETV